MDLSKLTVKDRICIHLSDYRELWEYKEAPMAITQEGIGLAVDSPRGYVASLLSQLEEDGLVKSQLHYIDGASRRRKSYQLTAKGRENAKQLVGDVRKSKVTLLDDSGSYEISVKDVDNFIEAGISIMEILNRCDEGVLDFRTDKPREIDMDGEKGLPPEKKPVPVRSLTLKLVLLGLALVGCPLLLTILLEIFSEGTNSEFVFLAIAVLIAGYLAFLFITLSITNNVGRRERRILSTYLLIPLYVAILLFVWKDFSHREIFTHLIFIASIVAGLVFYSYFNEKLGAEIMITPVFVFIALEGLMLYRYDFSHSRIIEMVSVLPMMIGSLVIFFEMVMASDLDKEQMMAGSLGLAVMTPALFIIVYEGFNSLPIAVSVFSWTALGATLFSTRFFKTGSDWKGGLDALPYVFGGGMALMVGVVFMYRDMYVQGTISAVLSFLVLQHAGRKLVSRGRIFSFIATGLMLASLGSLGWVILTMA